jgi:hypothetical protein
MTILSRDFDDFFIFAWASQLSATHKGLQVESVTDARGVASNGAEGFHEQ